MPSSAEYTAHVRRVKSKCCAVNVEMGSRFPFI